METTPVDAGHMYQDRELQHDLLHHRERPGGSHLRKFTGGTLPKAFEMFLNEMRVFYRIIIWSLRRSLCLSVPVDVKR